MKASGGLWQSIDTSEWRGQRKGRKERRKGSTTSNWGGKRRKETVQRNRGRNYKGGVVWRAGEKG